MVNVGVVGHTGRLGKILINLLRKHSFANIVYTESKIEGISGKIEEVEFMFLALPEGESQKYVSSLKGKKIIDLSSDHRVDNNWVYGLPEIYFEKIKESDFVANPGCYATSIILALAPIKKFISDICISSTSGISGAGKSVQKEDNTLTYSEGKSHKHIKEIENVLENKNILFVPQRIDVLKKGIISVIFANYSGKEDLLEIYRKYYFSKKFIKIVDKIETKITNGTNFCNIKLIQQNNKIILISSLDNLLKGGAGQAIQNFNLMCGFDETEGLI